MKINISIDDELVARIDKQANSLYMSRSGYISNACVQVLNSSEMILAIKDMAFSLRKIADNNIVDEDTLKKLEDFERISKMITGQ